MQSDISCLVTIKITISTIIVHIANVSCPSTRTGWLDSLLSVMDIYKYDTVT